MGCADPTLFNRREITKSVTFARPVGMAFDILVSWRFMTGQPALR
jgi:hypothetical protein